MNFSNLLNDFANQSGNSIKGVSSKIPGGLAGGAVAGGLVAVLLGNKTARKTATTAAKYGGAALLGGLAYKAYKNWQQNQTSDSPTKQAVGAEQIYSSNQQTVLPYFETEAVAHANGKLGSQSFELALVKAMIASARADGKIDSHEQRKISDAIEKLDLDYAAKSELLELFIRPIEIDDFVGDLKTIEQKAEAYLASCLVIDLDHQSEYAYLSNLSRALGLPPGLEQQLRSQANETVMAAV